MTQRKPPAVPFERWVDQQIHDAERRGAFTDLPGAGKPIPGIDRPRNELDWLAALLRREQVDPSVFLPPSLALPKEMEDLRGRLAREASEIHVRELVDDLNRRIRDALRRPQEGPPMRVMPLDPEQVVDTWREDRAELRRQYEAERAEREAAEAQAAAAAARSDGPPSGRGAGGRRSWWRRRARSSVD